MDVDHYKYENLVLIIKGRMNVPSSVKAFRCTLASRREER